jgi:hypothetical protein
MTRAYPRNEHNPNRKVDKESIIRMNKTFSMPEGQAGIDAMRTAVNAKLGSPDKGPSLADIRSAVNKEK